MEYLRGEFRLFGEPVSPINRFLKRVVAPLERALDAMTPKNPSEMPAPLGFFPGYISDYYWRRSGLGQKVNPISENPKHDGVKP
ncbi:hypothetical protein HY025_01290 [Candidatus Daviesbacteria bacterium]|nr:hypothetical protein [Candidatus Daviesbacteria bacterium]